MICATYICQQIYSAMLNMGIYYMIYILKNEDLYSVFSHKKHRIPHYLQSHYNKNYT